MEIDFNSSMNCMQLSLDGQLTTDEILNAFDNMVTHPNFKYGSDALWDLRKASHPDLTVSDLYNIGRHVQKNANKRGNGKTAWVVANDIDFGIARMFEMLTDQDISIVFRVFNSIKDAEEWINTRE